MQIVSSPWLAFLSTSTFWAVLANAQNITIEPSSTQSIQYLPADAWSFSSRPGASSNGSFAHTVAENATVIFNISVPATAFFWRGFLPSTAARYSICIDCTSESEIGNVVTLESATPANSSDTPVILFASNSLANTTHTVFLRNIRNSIEGVVGEMSVDALIFTPGIPDANDSIPPNHTSTDNKLVIAIAVVSGLIGIIVGTLVLLIRVQSCRNRPKTPQFSQKRPLLLTTGAWKRRRRKGDLESAPMIEGELKIKPPAINVTQAPTDNNAKNGRIRSAVAIKTNPNSSEGDVPYITVTSPTTIPTSASSYSTTHDVPFPPRPISKFGEAERGVRQSDPYINYAAAYAAFVGVEDDRRSSFRQQQRSALRESATLPPPPRVLLIDRNEGTSRGSSDHPPPSSFKGNGIRSDFKRKRTLSDKIRRGTLPPPPPVGERTSVTVEKKEATDSNTITTVPVVAAVASTSKSETDTRAPSPNESVQPSRPSFLPEFSSDSSPSTAPTTRDSVPFSSNNPTNPPSPVAVLPNRSSLQTTASSKDFSYRNGRSTDKDDGNTVPFPNNQAAKTAIRASLDAPLMEDPAPRNNMRSSSSLVESEIVIEGGGDTSPVVPNFNRITTISMMTTKTINTINTTRSSYSFTPSVSEFPMPPFNGANSNANAGEEVEAADDSSIAANRPTSTPIRTRTSSSASASETGSSAKSAQSAAIPPSSYPNRQRKPRGPPVRIAQLGMGLPISSQTPPLRRNSSKSSHGFRRSSSGRKASRLSQLPFKGEVLSISQRRSEDGEVDETVGSTLSLATSENDNGPKGTVPFYMASEPRLNADGSPEGVSSLNPSRLTIGSTLTTTDEEYASGVQVIVATRGVPPDLPRAIKQSTPSPVPLVTTPASEAITEQSSSDSKWEMVYPKPGPPQGLAPISISGANGSYRPNGPTANVPVSALTDKFDARSVESNIPLDQLDLPTSQSPNAGTGMPWSPNFLWPNTPPFEFVTRAPPTSDSLKPIFSPQKPVVSDSQKPREPTPHQPASTSKSVPEAAEAKNSDAETSSSSASSRPNIRIRTELGWKDVVGASSPVQTRARSNSKPNYNSRLSTYSTASSFFGGRETPMGPPPPFPLDTPLPTPPLATTSNDPGRQSTYFNMRGWQARSITSQSPVSPNPYSPRHTGSTPLNVNTVFATSGSSAPRPKSALRRTDPPES